LANKEFYERFSIHDRDLLMRVMVGSVVLYDYIDTNGAFTRQSPIDIRGIIDVIKLHGNEQQV
jgi:hypothetical protein